jgi:very-short-patch-repair endonuclease
MAPKCITLPGCGGGGPWTLAASVDTAIATLAARQHGYVARPQLLALGLSADALRHRVRSGHLLGVYSGVYAVGYVPMAPIDRAAGAVLACGPTAALSHGSAASLWGIAPRWTLPFEVTAKSSHRRRGIRVHRSGALTGKDLRRHRGIRVTSPARTLLDTAPRLSARRLNRAVNDLRLSNCLRISDLADLLERCPRHPGSKRLRPFVQAPNGPTRSQFEDAFLDFTERFDLPRPKLNARVGRYEVDALFVAEKVIVELDGYEYHSSQSAFRRDRDRDATNLVAGFVTVRVTWDRLTQRPGAEARRLLAILASRRHRRHVQ